jgi:hypothetical protein
MKEHTLMYANLSRDIEVNKLKFGIARQGRL